MPSLEMSDEPCSFLFSPPQFDEKEGTESKTCHHQWHCHSVASQCIGQFEVFGILSEHYHLRHGYAVVDDVDDGTKDNIARLQINDAEHYANGEGWQYLCPVEVDDAEEQGREKYCIYWPNAVS